MEAPKIPKARTPAQQAVPAQARAVKAVNDQPRKDEKERAKAEKRFDRALEALQALKHFIPAEEAEEPVAVAVPVVVAAKKPVKVKPVKVKPPPPPPPQELSEESESDEEVVAPPAKVARAKPVPVVNMAKRTFVFC